MQNIVIYARYSSSAQSEQSIEGQLRVCREYAQKNNLNILNEYIDRAMTGTNDNRPAFQQMIEDSKQKTFSKILVYKLDRFSRNRYDNAIYKHLLQQNNVKVISATEIISDTAEGLIMESLLEMFAELYSKDLSQKVKRGIKENILKGYFIGGQILYGYKVENKKIIINEKQAPAIKYIFEEYAKGTPKIDIVNALNNMGYRNNKNKKFTEQSLQNCLKNTKYIGHYKNDYIENNNYYPAIIGESLFYEVQKKLNSNKRFKTKSKLKFLLSGKLFCGYCGNAMIGTSGTSKSKTIHGYYTCIERNKRNNCKKSNENQIQLEELIINVTKNKILKNQNLETIAEKLIQAYNENSTDKQIENLKQQLHDVNKKLDNITKQFILTNNLDIIERLNIQANDLSELKSTLETQINKLKLSLKIKYSKTELINYLKLLINFDTNNEKQKIRFIDTFINSVYIFDDYYIIYIDIIGKNEKVSFSKAKSDINQLKNSVLAENTLLHQFN